MHALGIRLEIHFLYLIESIQIPIISSAMLNYVKYCV